MSFGKINFCMYMLIMCGYWLKLSIRRDLNDDTNNEWFTEIAIVPEMK